MKEKKHIDFEEENIADGFSPSEHYLVSLESAVFERLDIEEQFESITDGLNAPKAYFDNFDASILKTVGIETSENKGSKSKVVSLFRSKKNWMVAASVTAILTLGIFIPFNNTTNDVNFADLTAESEEWYLSQNELFLTESELGYILADEVFEIEIEDEKLDKELEDYILNNELYLLELNK